MSSGKIEIRMKKYAAAIALKFSGYEVKKSVGSVQVFEGHYEFCRLQLPEFMAVNDSPVVKKVGLKAYMLDDKERDDVTKILTFLRIDIERACHFVDPDGIERIINSKNI